MKKFMISLILLALFATSSTLQAQNQNQESLGLPGDNLNLYAVMKLFQESETLEVFEKNLNDQNSNINNLDLNGDNMVDYIRVIDNVDGDVHTIVLQVPIDKRESQDVAVFTVQKLNSGRVYIQLVGDEELYGKDYIIEPIYAAGESGQTPNPGYTGNNYADNDNNVTVTRTTTVEIAAWPLVRFLFMPDYVRWHSSWYYDYYPSYWHPWHPYYWDYYYGYHYNWYNDYYGHYHRSHFNHYTRWNDYYYAGRRNYSTRVGERIREGNFKSTYSHPDQRKDGEAKFEQMHPGQSTRRSDQPQGNSNARRSDTQTSADRQSPATAPVTTRRSENSETRKSVPYSESKHKATTTRRTPWNSANRSDSKPATVQNKGTNRRINENEPGRSTARPASESKAAPVKSSKETSRIKSGTSSRRSSSESKASTSTKQPEKAKAAESTSSSRRR
jgi:hypothetical protein